MIRMVAPLVAVALASCASEPAPAALPAAIIAAEPPPPAMPPPAHEPRRENGPGAQAWASRCRGCHDPATANTPTRALLEKKEPDAIVAALMTGKMQPMVPDMKEAEARDIAAYLTARVMPQTRDMPAAWP